MEDSDGFETLSWTPVHKGRVFEVGVEELLLPGGVRTRLDLILHPGAAAVLPLTSAGEVFLIRQFRRAAGGYLWEIPAGTLEPGEAPAACARRELAEEAGLSARSWTELGEVLPVPGYSTEAIALFAARGLESTPMHRDADEIITEIQAFSPRRLRQALVSGEIRDAKTMAALLRAVLGGLLDLGA